MDPALMIGLGLLALGAIVLVLEAFVPSGGILGVLAFLIAIVGVVYLFKFNNTWGIIGIMMILIMGPAILIGGIQLFPKTPIGREATGPSGEEIAQERDQIYQGVREERAKLMGMEGVAYTDMRPGGVVIIDGERYDAVARGSVIDKDERVEVCKIDGFSIEVRRV